MFSFFKKSSIALGSLFLLTSHSFASEMPEQSSVASELVLEDVGVMKDSVRHVTPLEASKLLKSNPDIKVLDVRTKSEYKRGHIEGATQRNYFAIGFKKKVIALNKDEIWIVHCKSGHRSGRTVPIMKKAGFTTILHMDGGFDAWKDAQLPISISK